jgi:hypothetical protein
VEPQPRYTTARLHDHDRKHDHGTKTAPASGGEGIGVGEDTSIGKDAQNRNIYQSTFGIGPEIETPEFFPEGGEFHTGATDTFVWRWSIGGFFRYINFHLTHPLGYNP